jgi:hypothetical protein
MIIDTYISLKTIPYDASDLRLLREQEKKINRGVVTGAIVLKSGERSFLGAEYWDDVDFLLRRFVDVGCSLFEGVSGTVEFAGRSTKLAFVIRDRGRVRVDLDGEQLFIEDRSEIMSAMLRTAHRDLVAIQRLFKGAMRMNQPAVDKAADAIRKL